MNLTQLAFLEASAGTGTPNGGSSIWLMVVMLVGIVLIFFFMSRSQKKRDQEIRAMRDGLVVGDEITTIGGIIGKIVSIKEETCMIETGKDKTRIRILKSAVRCVDVPAEAERAAQAALKAEEEKKAAEEAAAAEAAAVAMTGGKKKKKKKSRPAPETSDALTETSAEETPVVAAEAAADGTADAAADGSAAESDPVAEEPTAENTPAEEGKDPTQEA